MIVLFMVNYRTHIRQVFQQHSCSVWRHLSNMNVTQRIKHILLINRKHLSSGVVHERNFSNPHPWTMLHLYSIKHRLGTWGWNNTLDAGLREMPFISEFANTVVNIVPANSLAPLGARASAGTVAADLLVILVVTMKNTIPRKVVIIGVATVTVHRSSWSVEKLNKTPQRPIPMGYCHRGDCFASGSNTNRVQNIYPTRTNKSFLSVWCHAYFFIIYNNIKAPAISSIPHTYRL